MAFAQIKAFPIRPPVPNFQTFLGENQNYSIVFRGNGEAVISFKSVLYNPDAASLSDIKIHFPSNIQPQDFSVFQVIQQPYCIRYRPYPLLSPQQSGTGDTDQNCEAYQEPDYQNYYNPNTTYQKLTATYSHDTLTFSLFSPIQQNKYGSYFVYFRSFAYTHKNVFGAYEYSFQTPKFETKITSLQTGITTDSDLFLKGLHGKVQYQNTKAFGGMAPMAAAANSIRSPQFDQFYNQIGQGDIIKKASNLQPSETFTVNGVYAESNWKLYGKELGIGLIAVLVSITLLFVCIRLFLRKFTKKQEKTAGISETTKLFFIAGGLSFLSVFFLFLYAIGNFLILYVMRNSELAIVLIFFTLFLSFAIFLFLLFAVPIGLAIKKGYLWGIICFGLNIFWMMIFLGITLTLLFIFVPQGTDYVTPLRMLGM